MLSMSPTRCCKTDVSEADFTGDSVLTQTLHYHQSVDLFSVATRPILGKPSTRLLTMEIYEPILGRQS